MVNKFINKSTTSKEAKDEWNTPEDFFEPLYNVFEFNLDPCAKEENNLNLDIYYTKKDNGLKKDWFGDVYLNPPYSNIEPWLQKCWEEIIFSKDKKVNHIVLLLPASVGTDWFHKYIWDTNQQSTKHATFISIRFLKRRLQFEEPSYLQTNNNNDLENKSPSSTTIPKKQSATFDSMLVYFTINPSDLISKLGDLYNDKNFKW